MEIEKKKIKKSVNFIDNKDNKESKIFNNLIKRKVFNNLDSIIKKIRTTSKNNKFMANLYLFILINEVNKIYDSTFGYNFIKTLLIDLGLNEDIVSRLLNRKDKLKSIIIITYIILQFY